MNTVAINQLPVINSYLEFARAKTLAMDTSDDLIDQAVLATNIRYETLFKERVAKEVLDHTARITRIVDAERAVLAYTETYLLDLPIPYTGISYLAQVLIQKCKKVGYKNTPNSWERLARGEFDWVKELSKLSSLDVL